MYGRVGLDGEGELWQRHGLEDETEGGERLKNGKERGDGTE